MIAWGLTNSGGNWSDLIEIDPRSGAMPDALPHAGWRTQRSSITARSIKVKGQADEPLDVRSTIWGPVVDRDHKGRPRALRWVALDPDGVNLNLIRMATLQNRRRSAGAGPDLRRAPRRICVVGDVQGRIGWTIMGKNSPPGRARETAGFPLRGAGPGRNLAEDFTAAEEAPGSSIRTTGILWTANARVVERTDARADRLRRLRPGLPRRDDPRPPAASSTRRPRPTCSRSSSTIELSSSSAMAERYFSTSLHARGNRAAILAIAQNSGACWRPGTAGHVDRLGGRVTMWGTGLASAAAPWQTERDVIRWPGFQGTAHEHRVHPATPATIDYPDDDGQPMSDNTLQFKWIVLIKECSRDAVPPRSRRVRRRRPALVSRRGQPQDPAGARCHGRPWPAQGLVAVRTSSGRKAASPPRSSSRSSRRATAPRRCSSSSSSTRSTGSRSTTSTIPRTAPWKAGCGGAAA